MEKSKNKTIAFNIASTLILQGLAFFSGPIFSGILGTENYGIAAVYLTWTTLASTVFSLQAAGTLAVARINYPEEKQAAYQSSVFSLATISYLGFSILTVIFALAGSKWIDLNIPMILLGLAQGWGMYCVSAMNLKLTYEFKADKNFILSILISGLTIVISIILIRPFPRESNYWGRIIGQSLVYVVIGVILFVIVYRSGKTIYNKEFWLFTLPIAIPTIFHSLANIVLNQSDKVMLQAMVGNSAAGIYALAATFGTVVHSLWNALNNSWVPFYYEYTKNNQKDEIRRHAKNYTELFTIITVGFILLAREVFHIYASKDFWAGTDLIPLFAIGHYFIFLYSMPVNYEFYHKKTKMIAIGTTLAAVSNLALNYIMIRCCGILGAVIATAISHGLQFIFHFFCAKRIIEGDFPFSIKNFIPGFFAVCLSCGFYWITRDFWYIRWGVGMVLGVCLVIKIIKRREIF